MGCKGFLICSLHRYWIFDLVFFFYFLWRSYLFTCSTTPIFLLLSCDQGNLCDNGVIIVFDQKFFLIFKGICKFALTAQYYSISVLWQVWHAFSSPEAVFWSKYPTVMYLNMVVNGRGYFHWSSFCDTVYSGGDLRTQYVLCIRYFFPLICLHLPTSH